MSRTTESIRNDINTKKCLVKFTATWCGPCKKIHDELIGVCNESDLEYIELDVDEYPEIAQNFTVTSIPMMIISFQGKAKKVTGADMGKVRAAIDLLKKELVEIDALVVPTATINPL